MLGHAGFLTSLKKSALSGMIEIVKGIEPETGYGSILQSEAEHAMREHRIRKTKTVCTYCGVGCSFDVWTKDRHILKIAPEHGPANGISTFVKGKFGWGRINSDDRLTTPLIREADKSRAASWDEALDLVAQKLSGLKRTNGPDSIAFISSFKCTNEESDLMQELARAVMAPTMSTIAHAIASRLQSRGYSVPWAWPATRVRSPISKKPIWSSSSAATRRKVIRSSRPGSRAPINLTGKS